MEVGLRDYLPGAALATELALTVPGLRLGDRLTRPAEVAALLDAHGLPPGRIGPSELARARRLRDELVTLFDPVGPGERAERAARLLRGCPHEVVVGPAHAGTRHGDWRLRPRAEAGPVDRARLVIGAAALAVLAALGPDRFRRCAAEDRCVGLFIDTSNAGRRRFCAPRVCGNQVHVARYRAARRGDPAPPDT